MKKSNTKSGASVDFPAFRSNPLFAKRQIGFFHQFIPVLPLEPANREMGLGHALEMGDKGSVDRGTPYGPSTGTAWAANFSETCTLNRPATCAMTLLIGLAAPRTAVRSDMRSA